MEMEVEEQRILLCLQLRVVVEDLAVLVLVVEEPLEVSGEEVVPLEVSGEEVGPLEV